MKNNVIKKGSSIKALSLVGLINICLIIINLVDKKFINAGLFSIVLSVIFYEGFKSVKQRKVKKNYQSS